MRSPPPQRRYGRARAPFTLAASAPPVQTHRALLTLELAEASEPEVESGPESDDSELLEELADGSPDAGMPEPSYVFWGSASCSSEGSPIPTIVLQPKPATQATAPIVMIGVRRKLRITTILSRATRQHWCLRLASLEPDRPVQSPTTRSR